MAYVLLFPNKPHVVAASSCRGDSYATIGLFDATRRPWMITIGHKSKSRPFWGSLSLTSTKTQSILTSVHLEHRHWVYDKPGPSDNNGNLSNPGP